jgi:hypothetical protein
VAADLSQEDTYSARRPEAMSVRACPKGMW